MLTPLEIWRAHQSLPRPLRIQWLVPGTVLLVAFLGLTFTLPPGPLCDEGMILFMEGGCDWGESNVFLYSKLGLLLALNSTFILAWRFGIKSMQAFLPHIGVALLLAWATRSGGYCDTYYSHPNGSVGQMVIEVAAYGLVGLAILRAWSGGPIGLMATAMIAWTAIYICAFYAALPLFPHWTWSHTFVVAGGMLLIGAAVSSNKGS